MMEKKNGFTKVLIYGGLGLVWFTLLAPVLLSIAFFIYAGEFHFDYLMPAELALLAFGGGLLLLWAAIRLRKYIAVIGWGLGIALASLIGTSGLAVITGLASGDTEPGGWEWVLVLGVLVLYILALVLVGVGGVLLARSKSWNAEIKTS